LFVFDGGGQNETVGEGEDEEEEQEFLYHRNKVVAF